MEDLIQVVWFRRELRLNDHVALNACKGTVLPVFIFDDRQVGRNDYKSNKCVKFMMDCLDDLGKELKKKKTHLYTFKGLPHKIFEQLFKKHKVGELHLIKDYTKFSQERDDAVMKVCEKYNVKMINHHDHMLTSGIKEYKVFTPYYNEAKKHEVKEVVTKFPKFFNGVAGVIEGMIDRPKEKSDIKGGRSEALKILQKLGTFGNYKNTRDFPTVDTTRLSAYLKFGCVSVREVYHAMVRAGAPEALIRQLYWRDFYYQLLIYNPELVNANGVNANFNTKYDKLWWENDKKKFKAWCDGHTGYPIVDAAMIQLNTTGWMHNRCRMIVASFLTKHLHIDWRWGEKYFAQKLVDYDPAQNSGGWQWAASTGADAQPYFRVFNPWLQHKKFDPQSEYVKKYLPQLAGVDNKDLLTWYDSYKKHDLKKLKYTAPIVVHETERAKAIEEYKKV